MRRKVAVLYKAAIVLTVLAVGAEVARGADTMAAPARTGERAHPDARKINEGNARVFHAGPGTPLTGAVHVSPSQAKKDKAKEQ